jgi:hypothetical protein
LKQRHLVIRQKKGLPRSQIILWIFEFHQDFALGSVEETIYPLLGTAVACEIRPVNEAVTATNPKYNFSALVAEWTSVGGSVGNLLSVSASWPISGEITKSTS